MSGYAGTQYTSTVSEILTPDVLKKIILKQPDVATLTAFLKLTEKNNIGIENPTHTYSEDDNLGRWASCDGVGATAAAGTINLAGGDGWKCPVGTIIRVPRTGETILVTAVSTDALTVTRSWGATAAAIINPAEPLQIVGNAQLEGYTVGDGGQSAPVQKTARTQIFSHPFSVTGTMLSTKIYDDVNSYEGKKRKALIQHMADQDTTAMWGEIASAGSGATTRRSSTSLNETIVTNVSDFGGLAMSELAFQNALLPIFEVGSPRKILVASAHVANVVSNYSTMKLQTSQGQSAYGNAIRSYVFGSGELTIIIARKSLSGANSKTFFVVDSENCKRIYLNGNGKSRDTKLTEYNKMNTEVDAQKGEFMSESGSYFPVEESHMRGVNVGS